MTKDTVAHTLVVTSTEKMFEYVQLICRDMKARNRRRDAKLKARMRWSFEFEKVWNFDLL